MISRCLVPNTSIHPASIGTGASLDGGRPGVIQHQMIMPQGQGGQRMHLTEKITSPQQSPIPNNNRVNLVTQQGQPTVLRVERQPIPATSLTLHNAPLNTPLPTTLALPQVPISSAQFSASVIATTQSSSGRPSPVASPTISYSRATPSPGRTIFVQQQPCSPQATQGTGPMIVNQQQGTIIPTLNSVPNRGSTLIVQHRQPMPTLPSQPVAANQLPELFQRPRPPPPPSLNTNQNFQNVRILQPSGASNTSMVKTILIPCNNGSGNSQSKTTAGKQVFQIASSSGGHLSQIPPAGAQQQIQSGAGPFVNNTGTPLPTSIQLPSEPVPFTCNEMSQLSSNSMPAPHYVVSTSPMNNGRPSPVASPSRIIMRQENLQDQNNSHQVANTSNTKAQDGAKIMIQVSSVRTGWQPDRKLILKFYKVSSLNCIR